MTTEIKNEDIYLQLGLGVLSIVCLILFCSTILYIKIGEKENKQPEYKINLLNSKGQIEVITKERRDTISIDSLEEYIDKDNL